MATGTNNVILNAIAAVSDGAVTSRGDGSFGGGSRCDSKERRLLWQPGILISKERRLGQEAPFASEAGGYSSVTQPSDAFFTLLMYLYNVPRAAL